MKILNWWKFLDYNVRISTFLSTGVALTTLIGTYSIHLFIFILQNPSKVTLALCTVCVFHQTGNFTPVEVKTEPSDYGRPQWAKPMACGNAWCLTNVSTTPILLQQNQRPSGQCVVKLGSGYNYRKKIWKSQNMANRIERVWALWARFEHFGQQQSAISSSLFHSTMFTVCCNTTSCCVFCNLKSTSCISNFQISRLLKFPTNILKQGQFR